MVNSISGSGNLYSPTSSSSVSSEISKLERQKKIYQQDLQQLKMSQKKTPTEQAAAVKEQKSLEEKIEAIDKQIQQLSQATSQSNSYVQMSPEKIQETQKSENGSLSSFNSSRKVNDEIDKKRKHFAQDLGGTLDTYA